MWWWTSCRLYRMWSAPVAFMKFTNMFKPLFNVLGNNEKRKRRKLSEVPFFINTRDTNSLMLKRWSNRELLLSNVETINILHGLVLQLGTGTCICRDCRKMLLDCQNKAVQNLNLLMLIRSSHSFRWFRSNQKNKKENGNGEKCTTTCTKEARIIVFKCPEDSFTREFSTSAAVMSMSS